MSILTKICVVLVLVVSVAASGAFLRMVSVRTSWRNKCKIQEGRARVADLTAGNLQIALDKTKVLLVTVDGKLAAAETSLIKEQTERAVEKAAAARSAAEISAKFDALDANFTKLQTDLQTTLAMQEQLKTEKVALTKSLDTSNETARGLKKEFDNATVQIGRLNTMVKHYAILIKDLRAEKQELQHELETALAGASKKGGTAAVAVAPPDQPVIGRVTAAESGVASINLGQARGIKKGMMLTIFRGGKYVAHLRIDLVEPDTAAGVILDKKLEVVQGDEVATSVK